MLAKRILDLILVFLALPFFIPLWILIAILIKLDSQGPALYIHTRVGKKGREFQCYKFRTMKTNSDPNRLAESNTDDRITKLGSFLRTSSLDETLQLINVLIGDMSIVGPRPALPVQVSHFSERDKLKLNVKPGITGWTQVNGRNSIPYDRRMELDSWYAENQNFWLDLQIIFRTFFVLIKREGVYDQNSLSPKELKR